MLLALLGACASTTGSAAPGHDLGADDPDATVGVDAPSPGADESGTAVIPADGGDLPPQDASADATCADMALFDAAQARADVMFLASPELRGRPPGTPEDAMVRAMIERRFRCAGLTPGGTDGSYQQPFVNRGGQTTANVIGFLPGSDPAVASEIVLLGAHHDHLGVIDGAVHPGANDNASGVAGLLAIAHALGRHPTPPRRTIAFVAFGSEEPLVDPPYVEGSDFFVRMPPPMLPTSRVVYMINFDMIGLYQTESLVYAMGSFRDTPARGVLDELVGRPEFGDLDVDLGEGVDEDGDSDYFPFCLVGVPWIYFWTDDPTCYHEPCDTADRLDYSHLVRIAELAFELAVGVGNTTETLSPAQRIQCSAEDSERSRRGRQLPEWAQRGRNLEAAAPDAPECPCARHRRLLRQLRGH